MGLEQIINEDLKLAMKAKDRIKLDTLRGIKKEIIEAKTSKGASAELSEDVELKILQKMVKQRQDSASIYKAQNRDDLAQDELLQADLIAAYLPKQLSKEELESEIDIIIRESGADSMASMGKVMGLASKKFAGRADGKTISEIVRSKLGK